MVRVKAMARLSRAGSWKGIFSCRMLSAVRCARVRCQNWCHIALFILVTHEIHPKIPANKDYTMIFWADAVVSMLFIFLIYFNTKLCCYIDFTWSYLRSIFHSKRIHSRPFRLSRCCCFSLLLFLHFLLYHLSPFEKWTYFLTVHTN